VLFDGMLHANACCATHLGPFIEVQIFGSLGLGKNIRLSDFEPRTFEIYRLLSDS